MMTSNAAKKTCGVTSFKKGLKPWFVQLVPGLAYSFKCLIPISQVIFCSFVFVQLCHICGLLISSRSGPVNGSYLVLPGLEFNPEYVVQGLLPALVILLCLFPMWLIGERICRLGARAILLEDIERKVSKMAKPFSNQISPGPGPCFAFDLRIAEELFDLEFGINMPETYKLILGISNGIKYRALTLWPITESMHFAETIFEANKRLKSMLLRDCVYFGFVGDQLYAYDTDVLKFCSIYSKNVLNVEYFENADHMFKVMFDQAAA